jgi:hypothetical protein
VKRAAAAVRLLLMGLALVATTPVAARADEPATAAGGSAE